MGCTTKCGNRLRRFLRFGRATRTGLIFSSGNSRVKNKSTGKNYRMASGTTKTRSPGKSRAAGKRSLSKAQSGTSKDFDRQASRFKLTPREKEVLKTLAGGEPWKIIAARLEISVETVRFHVGNIHRKTGAANSFCAFCKIIGADWIFGGLDSVKKG